MLRKATTMDKMLTNVKNTSEVTGELEVKENETIYPSDTAYMMAEKIFNRFEVGNFVIVEGTEAHEFKKPQDIFKFPDWMELRIRCNSQKLFVIFIPKGMLVFRYLSIDCSFGTIKKQFKCEILHGDKLGYKIWRSK